MAAREHYIATIDVGTGSGRCILFDFAGNQKAVAQREWLPKSDARYPGSQDFDTVAAWPLLCSTVREAIDKAGIAADQVVAVTATAMREGMVLYDEQKNVIWACPNVDARATEEAAEMIRRDLARRIYRIGGDWLSIISPPRLWWIRNKQPEIYERIAHINMLSDWVLFRLSGELVTEPSIGSSSGMFDLASRTWSPEIAAIADLPQGIYPPVPECGTIIGRVTDAAAAETGLAAGTLVVTGGADTQMALVGAGAIQPGQYTVCAGTFWQTAVVTDAPLIDPQFRPRTLCHAVPGQWMTEHIGFYHGFAMRYVRDALCAEEVRRVQEQGGDAYAYMEELAQAIPAGSNGVFAIFANTMDAKCWKHASPSFVGLDVLAPARTGKAAMIRATEESAAYVTRGHLDVLVELTQQKPDTITFVGGSSKGRLWPQIVSDVLGVPLQIPKVKESTCLGTQIAVLIALGECHNWAEAVERVVRWERTVEPIPANHAVYTEQYARWRQIYDRLLAIADDGLLTSMWRAPGV